MKIIFVDAENVGLKELEKIKAPIVDKVLVFSRLETFKQTCEKLLYLCLSNYPEGANQADFHIIAHLSKTLVLLSREELNLITFELFSNDENLISAFKFQCELLGGNCKIIRTRSELVVSIAPKSAENKIYNLLKVPTELAPLQEKLKLSRADFTKVINCLVKESKIKRSVESKKKWVQVR